MKHQKLIENIFNSKIWINDNSGKKDNRILRILIKNGLSKGAAYDYLKQHYIDKPNNNN